MATALTGLALAASLAASSAAAAQRVPPNWSRIWVDHLDLLPGDPSVVLSYESVPTAFSNVRTGLIIESTTLGDTSAAGESKVVHKVVEVPRGYLLEGATICYEVSNTRTFINEIGIMQLQVARLVAPYPHLTDGGIHGLLEPISIDPVCVDQDFGRSNAGGRGLGIDPAEGPIMLHLRVNFGDTSDRIILRGLGLYVIRKRP